MRLFGKRRCFSFCCAQSFKGEEKSEQNNNNNTTTNKNAARNSRVPALHAWTKHSVASGMIVEASLYDSVYPNTMNKKTKQVTADDNNNKNTM